jgi:hypothetical protein
MRTAKNRKLKTENRHDSIPPEGGIQKFSAKAEQKGAIGFDREVRIKEACRGLLTRKQAELNTTADSFEYALAA